MSDVSGRETRGSRNDAAVGEARAFLMDDLVGRNDWKRSKFGYVTGGSMVSGIVRGFVGSLTGAFGRLSSLYRNMTRNEDTSALPEINEVDAAARFEAALAAYGKSEADVETMIQNSHRGFYFYAALLLTVLVIGIGSLRYGNISGLPLFFDVLIRFVTLPALAALMIRFGYLNWIVRNRALGGLSDYLVSGGLFPTKELGRAAAVVAAFVIGSLIAVSPDVALAQASPSDVFGTPHKDDVYFNMLGYIVPGIGPVDGYATNAHASIATGFMAFSAVLMLLGSMMLSWHVLAGVVASAYSGKVLGEQWHQIWAPGRVVLGLGSLAPVAGGYGAAQVLVVYLIVWGGNLANSIWTPYIQQLGAGVQGGQQTVMSPVDEEKAKIFNRLAGADEVIYQIARRELCNATANQYFDRQYAGGWNYMANRGMVTQSPQWESTSHVLGNVTSALSYGFNYLTSGDPVRVTRATHSINYGSLCGSISMTVDTASGARSDSIKGVHARSGQRFDEIRLEAVRAATEALRPHAATIAQTYNMGGEVSYAFDDTKPDTRDVRNAFQAALRQQVNAYQSAMMNAAQQQITALDVSSSTGGSLVNTLVNEASSKGWATAGAYYVTIGQVQSAVYSKAMSKPNFGAMSLDTSSRSTEGLSRVIAGSETEPGAVRAFDLWWNTNVNSEFSPIDINSAYAGRMDQNSDSRFESLLRSLGTEGMLLTGLNMFKDMNPFNPMRSMVEFGHTILMGFYLIMGLMLAAGVIQAGASMAGGLPGAAAATAFKSIAGMVTGGLGSIVVSFFGMLLIALFAVGVVHAYVIPMIPYIQVLFFIVGMLVLLVEALIAAPLWAFFHVRMDGQNLVDQVQRPGYMIAFNLLLRPALMILGLMMSFFVFGALAWFVSNTFTLAAVAAGSEHSVGPIGTIVMICIMTYLHYQIALRSFSLINQVPDRVTRWFGYSGEQLGEEGGNREAVGFALAATNRTEGVLRAGGAGGLARQATTPGVKVRRSVITPPIK